MSTKPLSRGFSRRDFLKVVGGVIGASVLTVALPCWVGATDFRECRQRTGGRTEPALRRHGWLDLPAARVVIPALYSDSARGRVCVGQQLTTYMFGFRNVTGLSVSQIAGRR